MPTVYIPRAFGGTIILTTTPVQQAPGLARVSDAAHGSTSISDVQIDQTTASDVATGEVLLSDQG